MSISRLTLALTVLFLLPVLAAAQPEEDALQQFEAALQSSIVRLRTPVEGKLLRYAGDGRLLHGSPDDATQLASAAMQIRQVRRIDEGVELRAERALQYFTTSGERRYVLLGLPVSIEVLLSDLNAADLKAAALAIFQPHDQAEPAINTLRPQSKDKRRRSPQAEVAFHYPGLGDIWLPGSGLSEPRAMQTFTRPYFHHGRAGARAVITLLLNTAGRAHAMQVEESDDPRFEEFVVDAVRNWLFSPATVRGTPVPIAVRLEMGYQLGWRQCSVRQMRGR